MSNVGSAAGAPCAPAYLVTSGFRPGPSPTGAMPRLRLRPALALAALLVVGGPLAWYVSRPAVAGAAGEDGALVARVREGAFTVVVTTTGELRAKNSVPIQGPANAQQAQLWNGMKIASLVAEGTLVKAGDVVAELDRGPAATKVSEVQLALQKAQALYTQAELDSALNLSQAREQLRTLEYGMEEKRIAKEQAAYEAPSVKRQAEIEYEKAERALAQAKVDYVTKTQQAKAKMAEVGADLDRQKNQLGVIMEVLAGHTVRAPSPGMVIYVREWNGRKKAVGSNISPWEPTVATLPDLTNMESVTYVNEIDVRRLAVGQPVDITLDADPDKRLKGAVVSVANVGEQRPNMDAKVFEVTIAVAGSDTTLRPGMTTSNGVTTATIPKALAVPLEAVTNEGALAVVFKQDGGRIVRQQIETGMMNDNEIVVARGLAANDAVLLSPPAARDGIPTVLLDAAPAGGDRERSRPVPVAPDTAAAARTTAAAAPRVSR